MAKTKFVPATTNNITKAIINLLRSEGHSASRVNTQGQYDGKLKTWRKSGSTKGVFDIISCIKGRNGLGRFLSIDIKKGNDKLNKDQIVFMKGVRDAGGIALEIESYAQFVEWYELFKRHNED